MPEGHCCLPLKGPLRSVNVTFPSPEHSVTHSLLIALLGVSMEIKTRMWSQSLGFVWRDKGISGHVNNIKEGHKRSSSELAAITKYHGVWAESWSSFTDSGRGSSCTV